MTWWNYIVIGGGLALLVALLWMELRRPNRRLLSARLIATVLAVSALISIMLPISCRQQRAAATGKEGVLLTEGYNADSVREFLRGHKGTKVITTDDTVMDRWHIFGYGLQIDEWTALRPPPLVFHPSATGTGLVAADWQRKLIRGQRLRLQGRWVSRGPRAVRLLLVGMGQVLDSATVKSDTVFELSAVPAQMGRTVYRFVALSYAQDTLEREDIPVEVSMGKPLKILLLASSPAAENTFLLNWLSKEGAAVASRTTVSKDKYQQAFVNRTQQPLGQLSSAMLSDFDLVIADASALSAQGVWSLLRRQVQENGLGLVVQVDSAGGTAIGVASGGIIKSQPGMRVIQRDSAGRIEVAGSRDGAGKILLTNYRTYPMVLAGEQERYAVYWSSLLREVARETQAVEEWRSQLMLARVREPVRFAVQTARDGMPQGVMGASLQAGRPATMYLAEDGVLPTWWEGRYWPVVAGWQTAATLQGDTSWWYAWSERAWKPLYREKRKRETEAFARGPQHDVSMGRSPAATRTGHTAATQTGPLATGWFYALFMLSLIFLWIERKMSG